MGDVYFTIRNGIYNPEESNCQSVVECWGLSNADKLEFCDITGVSKPLPAINHLLKQD